MKKKTIVIISMFIIALLIVNFTSAEFWACFNKGDIINYCDNIHTGQPYKDPEMCDSNSGCERCMKEYRRQEECYIHSAPMTNCYNTVGASNCEDNPTKIPDETPPEFNLIKPSDSLFDSTRVLVEFSLNEKAGVYYDDLDDSRELWRRVCSNCQPGNPSYSRENIFKEGKNNISFKAVDLAGNAAYENISFFIDADFPRISRTAPRSGEYSSGLFNIEFIESNPEKLKLKIEYSGGEDEYNIDLENNCIEGRTTTCDSYIDISKYDGEEINYWFELKDVASNIANSRKVNVKVDSIKPIINSVNYDFDGRYYNFIIDFTETFPESVKYVDLNDERARPRDLCRRFENGICEGRISLRDGDYDLEFRVSDEAGNYDTEQINIFIDTRAPRIYRINPTRGFADGNFDIQFMEDYPEILTLYYGNETETQIEVVDISKNCDLERGRYYCNAYVNLEDYDGGEIEYWFVIEDGVGNKDESRKYKLDVDVTKPVINNEPIFSQGEGRYSRYIYFDINITEENFKEVVYSYIDYRGRERERRLCSRLRDGVCETRAYFREGEHELNVIVRDKAGNFEEVPISFEVIY